MTRKFRIISDALFYTAVLLSMIALGVASANPLSGTSWQLLEFQSMDDQVGTQRPEDPALYTMQLNTDGTVSMRLNCNRATGSWSAEASANPDSGHFKFGPLAMTRALCPPPSMDESIAAQSHYIRSYLLKDGNLYLSLMADGGIYAWEPAVEHYATAKRPTAPEQGGPRNWEASGAADQVDLREQASNTSKSIARYPNGTIFSNLGCRQVEAQYWCDVQLFTGGPRGFIPAQFLKPAVSPDGSVAMGPDDSAMRAGQGQFDATGKIPCAQSAGQPMTQCDFGVARAGGGYATVVIKRPDGSKRALFFSMGKLVGADTSQADGYPEVQSSKQSDLHQIRIGNERYEIPDAVILGG